MSQLASLSQSPDLTLPNSSPSSRIGIESLRSGSTHEQSLYAEENCYRNRLSKRKSNIIFNITSTILFGLFVSNDHHPKGTRQPPILGMVIRTHNLALVYDKLAQHQDTFCKPLGRLENSIFFQTIKVLTNPFVLKRFSLWKRAIELTSNLM